MRSLRTWTESVAADTVLLTVALDSIEALPTDAMYVAHGRRGSVTVKRGKRAGTVEIVAVADSVARTVSEETTTVRSSASMRKKTTQEESAKSVRTVFEMPVKCAVAIAVYAALTAIVVITILITIKKEKG